MMLIGSGLPILPIIQWDEQMIGNGTKKDFQNNAFPTDDQPT
jgi:hypothetical protein